MGTFIGLKIIEEDLEKIVNFQRIIKLKSSVSKENLHCTLFASLDNFTYKKEKDYLPLTVDNLRLGKIKTQQGIECLALFSDSNVLTQEYEDIKNNYRTQSYYKTFVLHITLSYNCGDIDISNIHIENFIEKITFNKSYQEKLILE